jgi:hypothetical protein
MKTPQTNTAVLIFLLSFSLAASSWAQPAKDRKAEKPSGSLASQIGRDGPKPGSSAPDFKLQTLDGKTIEGAKLWKEKPLVFITGSYTCPVFRRQTNELDSLVKDFGEKVHFLLLYTVEAHPKGNPSPYSGKEWVTPANQKAGILVPQPTTMEERLKVARDCATSLKLKVPLVIDTLDNATWQAYGRAPNCAYLINKEGKIVAAQPWFDGGPLRAELARLLEK